MWYFNSYHNIFLKIEKVETKGLVLTKIFTRKGFIESFGSTPWWVGKTWDNGMHLARRDGIMLFQKKQKNLIEFIFEK